MFKRYEMDIKCHNRRNDHLNLKLDNNSASTEKNLTSNHRKMMNTKFAAFLVLALVVAAIYLPSGESFRAGDPWKRDGIQVYDLVFFLY